MERLDQFLEHKGLVFGIAYRMTGSFTDAEDIVQETFLRWSNAKEQLIRSPKAFLSTIATRLSLDTIRKTKRKKETYIGPWLPEPIPANNEDEIDPDTLDLAFLHLLEKLNPVERAVFLLRESFALDYEIISKSVGKKQDACRQILKRAKENLRSEKKKFNPSLESKNALIHKFLLASSQGNPELLLPLLREDIVVWSDGGGKVHAARIPIMGKPRAAAFLIRTRKNQYYKNAEHFLAQSNGTNCIIVYRKNQPIGLHSFAVDEKGISKIHTILNPEKLTAFSNKQALIDDGKLVPLSLFLLFPKKNFFRKPIPIWAKPLANVIKWIFT
ncbi:DNA-directed RNA polymerase sigma-70 factor [Leptospira kobayashii]|uniref:DNA-directed RNA polymerase sigma-70 factor n=1 Tax=Leptospira kobayashii TaxID=1917830 RepID=A0ABN6KAF7_9LEPT|nr:sigma-70 family RNA polymerase sigma factor [Leptospira kobayashii]BDA77756.1 DNA-directed RNA polymerase sigma-70 factor [Leptospira kobayashii]